MHNDTYGAVQAPPANGTVQSGDVRGKRIANRAPWIELPEPFDNLKVRVWLDYPQDVANLLIAREGETQAQSGQRISTFLKEVVLEHDGWEDDDGVLPRPDTNEFWARIPTPLGRAIAEGFFAELQAGKSPASRTARRKSWKRR